MSLPDDYYADKHFTEEDVDLAVATLAAELAHPAFRRALAKIDGAVRDAELAARTIRRRAEALAAELLARTERPEP